MPVLAGTVVIALSGASGQPAVGQDKQAAKEPEKKSGTVIGVLTGKGPSHIEVKADGEEKARRYVPQWRGGAPGEGGGPDKKMVAAIRDLKIGSRVRVEWEFDERARVMRVEVLQRPAGKDDEKKNGEKK
jgi:hypothetical protein